MTLRGSAAECCAQQDPNQNHQAGIQFTQRTSQTTDVMWRGAKLRSRPLNKYIQREKTSRAELNKPTGLKRLLFEKQSRMAWESRVEK